MAAEPPRRKAPTRADVARLAGVAPTTVSLILNGRAEELKIAPATRQRVEDAARRLHYVPNSAARALRRQHSQILGLLWGYPRNALHAPIYADVVTSAIARAQDLGYFVLLLPPVPDDPTLALQAIRDTDLAGLLCQVGEMSHDFGTEVGRTDIPVVWLEPEVYPRRTVPPRAVAIDPGSSLEAVGRHLREQGCRRLAFVVGPHLSPVQRYRHVAKGFGGRGRTVHASAWTAEAGEVAMEALLTDGPRPDAIFAGNDMLAAGALRACQHHEVAVPDHIAVAGFGGFNVGLDTHPTLTTVSWPLDAMASTSVEMLVAAIEGREVPPSRVLTTDLVLRESTSRHVP